MCTPTPHSRKQLSLSSSVCAPGKRVLSTTFPLRVTGPDQTNQCGFTLSVVSDWEVIHEPEILSEDSAATQDVGQTVKQSLMRRIFSGNQSHLWCKRRRRTHLCRVKDIGSHLAVSVYLFSVFHESIVPLDTLETPSLTRLLSS